MVSLHWYASSGPSKVVYWQYYSRGKILTEKKLHQCTNPQVLV